MKRLGVFLLLVFLFFIVGFDGVSAQSLSNPQGIAVDSLGNRYVSDTGNNQIIKIDPSGGSVVFAGGGSLGSPYKIMFGPSGDLYVADRGGGDIKKISPSGVVSTVAGSGVPGHNDVSAGGNLLNAQFDSPEGLYVIPNGNIIVADTGNNAIRIIDEGASSVSTIAMGGGTLTCSSFSNCPSASLDVCSNLIYNSPKDVVVRYSQQGSNSNRYDIYIADTGNHAIQAIQYEITNSGTVLSCNGKLLAGSGSSGYYEGGPSASSNPGPVQFDLPVAIDAVDYNSNGEPSLTGISGNNKFWVVDRANHVVRYLQTPGVFSGSSAATTTPFAGIPQSAGIDNGGVVFYTPGGTPASSSVAKLTIPSDIYVSASNNFEYSGTYDFYITDSGNNRLRKLEDANIGLNDGVWNMNWVPFGLSGSCTGPEDVILRLSDVTNAHGEVFNGVGNYGTEICYSTLFPSATVPVSPLRDCSGGAQEKVVVLSGSTNAHAEAPGANIFQNPVDVCYEGLTCQAGTPGSCGTLGTGYVEVVDLSSVSNAHLELPGGSGGYGTAICCSVGAAPPVGGFSNLEWRDFSNVQIPPTNNINNPICVGNWVKSYVSTGALTGTIEFDLFENDVFIDDPIKTITGTIDASGNVDADWEITQADYDLGRDTPLGLPLENRELEFYFVAREPSPGTAVSGDSYDLWPVTDDLLACSPTPPTGGITSPVHLGTYFTGNTLNMDNDCASSIGPLSYSWEVWHSSSTTPVSTSTSSSYDFTLPQNQAGSYSISLTCTNIDSGLKVESQSVINVLESPGLTAYINDPGLNGIETGNFNFPTEISFSASDTFAVLVFGNNNDPSLDPYFNCAGYCLAATNGVCPHQYTIGIEPNCVNHPNTMPPIAAPGQLPGQITITSTSFLNGVLSANNIPLVLPDGPNGLDGLNFDWQFSDSNWNQAWSLNGAGKASGFVQFDDMSNQINDKNIDVSVTSGSLIDAVLSAANNIAPTPASLTDSHLPTREFTLGYCLNGKQEFLRDPVNGITENTGPPPGGVANACKGADGIESTYDDCCPSGQQCLPWGSGTDYHCQFPPGPTITACGDYGDSASCNSDDSNVAGHTYTLANPGQSLTTCQTAQCNWNSGAGACGLRVLQHPSDPSTGQCDPVQICSNGGGCDWIIESGDCINGVQTISRTGTPVTTGVPTVSCLGAIPAVPAVSCTGGDIEVACGRLGFELPYFGILQFIASALIIALIYSALLAGKGKRKNE